MSNYIMELRKVVGHRPLIQAGSSVIVINRNEILLQLRADNNKWGLPGGSVEIGEKVEETGLNIKIEDLKLFGVFSGMRQYYKYPHGDEVYNVVTSFTASVFDGKLDDSNDESSSLKFFNIESLPSEINPPDIEIVERYKSVAGREK